MKKLFTILLIILSIVIITYAASVFSDNFEDGTFDAWDYTTTDSGDLSVHADAALHGSYGAKFVVDDTNDLYMESYNNGSNTRFRFRFYIDPNSLSMDDGEYFTLFQGFVNTWGFASLTIRFRYNTDHYDINIIDYTDGTYGKSSWGNSIPDNPCCIEVDWKAATGAGNDDGYFTLYVDGEQAASVTGINSDTENISHLRLGAHDFSGTPTGTFYCDDFVSNADGTEIGEISDAKSDANVLFIFSNF